MGGDRKKQWLDFIASLVIVGVSMYPLYRDQLGRYRLWLEQWLTRKDAEAEAMKQVQREISLMEHGQ